MGNCKLGCTPIECLEPGAGLDDPEQLLRRPCTTGHRSRLVTPCDEWFDDAAGASVGSTG